MRETCQYCGASVDAETLLCSKCGERIVLKDQLKPISIFYSYSHNDEDLRDELEAHLAALRHSGLIQEWHDRRIIAGQDWNREISTYLESAELILFLVSSDFINSSYIYQVEARRALDRQRAGQAVVVPVILRPVLWSVIPEFSRLQALPEGARPVTEWHSHDLAFVSVCEGIVAIILSRSPTAPQRSVVGSRDGVLRRDRLKSHGRGRIFDAALPSEVPVAKPSTLLFMIRRTDSPGLRSIVEADPALNIRTEDIDSLPVTLKFPIDKNGTPLPLDLNIKIESPQFEPKSQVKSITVPLRGDSQPRIFLLTPTQSGPLSINLEICQGENMISGCLLRTTGVPFQEGMTTSQCVTSASLPLSDDQQDSTRKSPPSYTNGPRVSPKGVFGWLKSLFADTKAYPLSSIEFSVLDIEEMSRKLQLKEEGEAHGRNNQPPSGGTSFDSVEAGIVTTVQSEFAVAHERYVRHMRSYEEQQANLELHGHLAHLVTLATLARADFIAQVANGLDRNWKLGRELSERENELQEFRRENGLAREPRMHHFQTLHWGVIAVLALIAPVLHGVFLARGNELGVLGGLTQAVVIALLNVGVGYAAGRYLFTNVNHRRIYRKALGYASMLMWVSIAFSFNRKCQSKHTVDRLNPQPA